MSEMVEYNKKEIAKLEDNLKNANNPLEKMDFIKRAAREIERYQMRYDESSRIHSALQAIARAE